LTVNNNQPPTPTILSPQAGARYNAGTTVTFAGSATDPEQGLLPSSALSWTIVFHHGTHTHPFLGPINGVSSGQFDIPDSGETAVNVFYRIHLTATDSQGRQTTTTRDILPNVVNLTLLTDPPGFDLTLDGQPVATPFVTQSVVGMSRSLGADASQRVGKKNYPFLGWSDGGDRNHDIITPAVNTVYTAVYRNKGGGPSSSNSSSNNSDRGTGP
jgi:hypothetical protein